MKEQRVTRTTLYFGAASIIAAAAVLGLPSGKQLRITRLSASQPTKPFKTSTGAHSQGAFGHIPVTFVENRGQTDRRVRFVAQGNHWAFFLTPDEVVLSLKARNEHRSDPITPPMIVKASAHDDRARGVALSLQFVGANPDVAVEGGEAAPGKFSYFHGNDPARWQSALNVASGIAVDSAGNAYIVGFTESSDFPTTAGAFDRTFNSPPDIFVT